MAQTPTWHLQLSLTELGWGRRSPGQSPPAQVQDTQSHGTGHSPRTLSDTHHICLHSAFTHTHTHGTVRAGVILTDELIWRLFSHYANLQRGKVFACLPESSSLVALSFTAHLHEGSTLTSVSGCNWTSEPAHRLMWDPSGVRECISPTGCTLVPYGNISWFLFYAKQLTRVFEHMQPGE